MTVLEILGALTLLVLGGLAVGHAMGVVKFSAEITKD